MSDFTALVEQAYAWLKSEAGHRALLDSVTRSETVGNELKESHKVGSETLRSFDI